VGKRGTHWAAGKLACSQTPLLANTAAGKHRCWQTPLLANTAAGERSRSQPPAPPSDSVCFRSQFQGSLISRLAVHWVNSAHNLVTDFLWRPTDRSDQDDS